MLASTGHIWPNSTKRDDKNYSKEHQMRKPQKKLKYARMHTSCGKDCTVREYKEISVASAYRLVTKEEPNEADFLPPAVVHPVRTFSSRPVRCRNLALSLFTTRKGAKNLHERLARTSNYFKNALRFVTETRIRNSDGRVSGVERNGHFGLHEYEGSQVAMNAKTASKVNP